MKTKKLLIIVSALVLMLLAAPATADDHAKAPPHAQVHAVEIVCSDVDAQCALLESIHGLSFGKDLVPEMGNARIAEAPDGSIVTVRAPLAAHESAIVRTYFAVEDIQAAVKAAAAAGAIIAYGPMKQGDTGTWAIYILNEVQVGLWQK